MTRGFLSLITALLLVGPLGAQIQSTPAAPVAGQVTVAQKAAPAEQLAQLSEDYWDTLMRLSPLSATMAHYPKYHDKLDDNSAAGRAKEASELKAIRGRLTAISRSALSPADRITWDLMQLQIDQELERQAFKFWQFDVDHMDGPQAWIPMVVELGQPMATADDAKALVARMQMMPGFFANQIENLRAGMKDGRVAAQLAVRKTIQQLDEMLQAPAEKTAYASAARRLPAGVREAYEPEILKAVNEMVVPSYRTYFNFLKNEYLAQARPDDKPGLSYLPGGKEAYRWDIRYHTTLPMEPEQLHKIGLEEMAAIQAEMKAIAERLKFKGDLTAFIHSVRAEPDNFFATREEMVSTAEELVARIDSKLPQYFGTLPKTPLLVKPMEEYREKNAPGAEYLQPSEDFSRPGTFYLNTYEPHTRPRFSMTALAAHEGVPGHHLQIALAMENTGLPAFRRHGDSTAFVEGWALYGERLCDEMGLYPDDLSRLGMLTEQAWRAGRLVVDTGLHSMGWSRQKAVAYLKDNAPMSESEIVSEVDRYVVWPGQALAYKVGQREILQLRKESQAKLGDKFDIRAFHDDVLKNGAIPLPILRKVVLGTL